MRTIKFRGKCSIESRYTGEWAHGGCVQCEVGNVVLIISAHNENCKFTYHVVPETVGQFTGLKDKNGNEIYEGDIIRWERDKKLYCVTFRSGMFYANVEECNEGVYGGYPLWALCEVCSHCVIVGNRYDNPELLEEDKQ